MSHFIFMKNHVLLFLIFLISDTITFSQHDNIDRNHLGINFLSLKYIGKNDDYLFFENRLCMLNGINFKKDFKLFTARYSLNYNRFTSEVDWIGPDSYSGFHYYSIWSISSGIQKNNPFNKISLFYGPDLINILIIYRTDLSGGLGGNGIQDKVYDNWLGLGIIMGIEYKLLPHISISLETSYNLQFVVFSSDYSDKTQKVQHYYNPVNELSIGYRF